MRILLNNSVYFLNRIYDLLLGVDIKKLNGKEKIEKKNSKVFFSNMSYQSSTMSIMSLILINLLFLSGFVWGWNYFLIRVLVFGVFSYFLIFFYVEKNDYYIKDYYSKSFNEIGMQSLVYFLCLLIIPLIFIAWTW